LNANPIVDQRAHPWLVFRGSWSSTSDDNSVLTLNNWTLNQPSFSRGNLSFRAPKSSSIQKESKS
jgi:hypothetical protein